MQELIHRKPVGELDRRLHHLLETERPFRFERERHRVHERRNRRAEWTVAGDGTALLEEIRRGRFGCGTLPVDHDDLACLRVVNHRRRFAAEAEVRDLTHGRREYRGDTSVDGVAALLEHADAGGDRVMAAGGHDGACAANFRPHRFTASRGDPWRFLGCQSCRRGQRGDGAEAKFHMRLIV